MKRKTLFLFLFTIIIYAPLLGKNFNSDDFSVLRRIALEEHGILIKGFFRIIADSTFYITYILFDFRPFFYVLTNICLHALVVVLVFNFAKTASFIEVQKREKFAWLAALLFLFYPFHNESVLWIVGRGALLTTLLGIVILRVGISTISLRWKYLVTSILYFIGLLTYESIIIIPVILFIIIYRQYKEARIYIYWLLWLGLAFFTYFIIRYIVAGVIVGGYGGTMFSISFSEYALKYFKALGRLLVPPFDKTYWFVSLVILVLFAFIIYIIQLWKKKKNQVFFYNYVQLWICLLISVVVPLFGVSTHNFEGDRLLYFPSVFFVLLLAQMLMNIESLKVKKCLTFFIAFYFISCFYINIYYWFKANNIINSTLTYVINQHDKRKTIIVNLPQEEEGIFVFRNGFFDALLLNSVDTSKYQVANFVTSQELKQFKGLIKPEYQKYNVFIPPGTIINNFDSSKMSIIYWDKNKWQKF